MTCQLVFSRTHDEHILIRAVHGEFEHSSFVFAMYLQRTYFSGNNNFCKVIRWFVIHGRKCDSMGLFFRFFRFRSRIETTTIFRHFCHVRRDASIVMCLGRHTINISKDSSHTHHDFFFFFISVMAVISSGIRQSKRRSFHEQSSLPTNFPRNDRKLRSFLLRQSPSRKSIGIMFSDETRGSVSFHKVAIAQNISDKRNIVLHPLQKILIQRRSETSNGMTPRSGTVRNDLRQDGIVKRRYVVTGNDSGVDANVTRLLPLPHHRRRLDVFDQGPGAGQKSAKGIFGVNPGLDGVSRIPDVGPLSSVLGLPFGVRSIDQIQILLGDAPPRRHFQHAVDQIYVISAVVSVSRYEFRHGMFHLQSRVHFEEVEVLVFVHEEFDRPGRFVVDVPNEGFDLPYHFPARGREEVRRRRLLDDFLVPPLNGAFSLGEAENVQFAGGGVASREDLDFDVMGVFDVLFDQEAIVPEEAFGFGRSEAVALLDLGGVVADSHAFASASGGGFDHDGVADFLGDFDGVVRRSDHAIEARNRRHPRRLGNQLGLYLIPQTLNGMRRRPNELDLLLLLLLLLLVRLGTRRPAVRTLVHLHGLHPLGKTGVLAQKSIPGMHPLRPRLLDRPTDLVDVEVALGRGRRPDADGLVGEGDVRGFDVGGGVDGHGGDAVGAGRAEDAAGDFAAVGDEDFAKGGRRRRRRRRRRLF
mmetsp:Transcript_482/g.1018  ORF Transcript_482/g.1018 Transcript_482/m.1018 type:complete len:696 (+) Transcript_482:336-2423(+)